MKMNVYPLSNRAEKGGYEVIASWMGVYQEFKFGIAQAGDSFGEVTLKIGKYKWSVGKTSLMENIFGAPKKYRNLANPLDICTELVSKAANDNIGLDFKLLREVLTQALLPYGFMARMELHK